MDALREYIPSGEKGYLPYYLYFVSWISGFSPHIRS